MNPINNPISTKYRATVDPPMAFAGGSMVARYCVLAGNSIYLKNMVYHVAAFFCTDCHAWP